MLREFLAELDEIYVKNHVGLQESLKIMCKHSNEKKMFLSFYRKNVNKTAENILKSLSCGDSITDSFASCDYLNFDSSFISFIEVGEKTGDLRRIVSYLKNKYDRMYENKRAVIEAGIYPVFVIFLAVALSIFLMQYLKMDNLMTILKLIFGLIFCSIAVFLAIYSGLKNDNLYEAFFAMDFMVKSGNSVFKAIEVAEQIVGVHTKYGRLFFNAKKNLEMGLNYEKSFAFGDKYAYFFYLADNSGGKNRVFKLIADKIQRKNQIKKKICMSMVEPCFLMITGIFILALILTCFLPGINNFEFGI